MHILWEVKCEINRKLIVGITEKNLGTVTADAYGDNVVGLLARDKHRANIRIFCLKSYKLSVLGEKQGDENFWCNSLSNDVSHLK